MKTYLLRSSDKDRRSYEGRFQYPESGAVAAPDWNPAPQCGGGLHGLLMGVGDGDLLNWADDATWQVLEVEAESLVDLGGKVKVERAEVVYSGARDGAIAFSVERGADPTQIVCGQATASGDYGQATASGTRGQATASGDYGQATASGRYGQATASGHYGQATASGTRGQATASGHYGQATASGDYGQATAAGGGLALARWRARSGEAGLLICLWWDTTADRQRATIGYVGETAPGVEVVKPDTWYTTSDTGELVEMPEEMER